MDWKRGDDAVEPDDITKGKLSISTFGPEEFPSYVGKSQPAPQRRLWARPQRGDTRTIVNCRGSTTGQGTRAEALDKVSGGESVHTP